MPQGTSISNLKPEDFKGLNEDNVDICTVEVTVPTGLEDVCSEEAQTKFGVDSTRVTGRIFFDLPIDELPKVLELRSAENVQVIVHMQAKLALSHIREECFEIIFHLAEGPLWRKGVKAWQKIYGDLEKDCFQNEMSIKNKKHEVPKPLVDLKLLKEGSPVSLNLPEEIRQLRENVKSEVKSEDKLESNSSAVDDKSSKCSQTDCKKGAEEDGELCSVHKKIKLDENSGPSFRVTCNRSGGNHSFGSQEAARQLGASINEKFGWPVNLKGFAFEIILNISDNFACISFALTKTPLFQRNLIAFGPTNLRATLCYALVHLSKPQKGDVVLDHMCGGASISVEGSLAFPSTFHLGGDIHDKAVARARLNIDHVAARKSLRADVTRWDSTRLPLKDSCVDVVVSDLPFGKRCGSKTDNRILYLKALEETARVTRPVSGRAVLLTHDRNSMLKNLVKLKEFWKSSSCRTINIGGLAAAVFILHRTNKLFVRTDTEKKTCEETQ